nr:histone-lysine N-methyltransferase 2D-like [Gorilla gorilla gorilla]
MALSFFPSAPAAGRTGPSTCRPQPGAVRLPHPLPQALPVLPCPAKCETLLSPPPSPKVSLSRLLGPPRTGPCSVPPELVLRRPCDRHAPPLRLRPGAGLPPSLSPHSPARGQQPQKAPQATHGRPGCSGSPEVPPAESQGPAGASTGAGPVSKAEGMAGHELRHSKTPSQEKGQGLVLGMLAGSKSSAQSGWEVAPGSVTLTQAGGVVSGSWGGFTQLNPADPPYENPLLPPAGGDDITALSMGRGLTGHQVRDPETGRTCWSLNGPQGPEVASSCPDPALAPPKTAKGPTMAPQPPALAVPSRRVPLGPTLRLGWRGRSGPGEVTCFWRGRAPPESRDRCPNTGSPGRSAPPPPAYLNVCAYLLLTCLCHVVNGSFPTQEVHLFFCFS